MSVYYDLAVRYLEEQGIKYKGNGTTDLTVTYNTENLPHVAAKIFFDDDGTNMLTTRTWDIASFKGKEASGYEVCNKLNNQYRWGKFFVDKDGDICFQCDAYLDKNSCGEEVLFIVRRIVGIVDDAYPEIARARFA
jgi:hypothetical protein